MERDYSGIEIVLLIVLICEKETFCESSQELEKNKLDCLYICCRDIGKNYLHLDIRL